MSSNTEGIEVVNVRGLDPQTNGAGIVYVGRRCGKWQNSILGNPFKIGVHGTREEVIDKYRDWLKNKLETDQCVQSFIMDLVKRFHNGERLRLGCWCAPLSCHAEVIKEVVEDTYNF